jgi:hypothetical protein
MHVEDDGTHTYSHTSLSLWRLCKRRWYNRYVKHIKEPSNLQAAWSVNMVHKPIELTQAAGTVLSEAQWLACFEGFRNDVGNPNFEDHIHTVGTSKRIFDAIACTPTGLENIRAESTFFLPFSNLTRYSSKPDIIGTREGRHFTVDFKYTERAWKTATTPWPVKPLLPYDDQLLGQSILAEADGYMRGTIAVEPKTGKIAGPIFEERLVDGQLRKEWLAETKATIEDIERWLWDWEWKGKHHEQTPWPKNTDACNAFGKPCSYLISCKTGWNLV